jgi:hypothetical protein
MTLMVLCDLAIVPLMMVSTNAFVKKGIRIRQPSALSKTR